MSRRLSNAVIGVAVLALIGFLITSVYGVIFTDFPRDRSGNVGAPNFFVGSGGTFTVVTPSDPLPVTTGVTTSTTDPIGWGKQFLASNETGGTGGACVIMSSELQLCKDHLVSNVVIASRDKGLTWTAYGNGGLVASQGSEVAVNVGGGIVIFSGRRATVDMRRSVNNGISWAAPATPPPDSFGSTGGIQDMAANADTVIAVGKGDFGHPAIWRSADQGTTWAQATDPLSANEGLWYTKVVHVTDTTWLTIAGCHPQESCGAPPKQMGHVFRSTDDGATWSLVTTSLQALGCDNDKCMGPFKVLTLGGVRTLLAVEQTSIFTSSDDGTTWVQSQGVTTGSLLRGIGDMGAGIWLAISLTISTGSMDTFRSVDSGGSWFQAQSFGVIGSNQAPQVLHADNSSGIVLAVSQTGTNAVAVFFSAPLVGQRIIDSQGNVADINTSGHLGVFQGNAGSEPGWLVEGSQRATLRNSRSVSALDTAVTITISAVAGEDVRLYSLSAFCDTGTAPLTVNDGGTTIWEHAPAGTEGRAFNFSSVGLRNTTGNTMTITLGTCGAGNTGTVSVHASQF